ncbi:class A beta-lactamase [Halomonas sp. DSH1-27]|nr:class A beta-lactamase [Halomonas sp. MMH1-48]MCG7589404.1 class A beta-lactamase [Halomonas sp. McD50-5]MCG7603724.1 class A beta-lactamase [Halomonas sp. MM17-34]MCG7612804.1 class A beta-lactamase [Halomonas sp. MM17-29]MCG7615565.1 class A beta-lactamase [Halomonas sp. McD50-4]MCG7619575.1 class A beta-lactamase [Halomonas sp. DSH1-27]
MAQDDPITAELARIEQALDARIGFAAHNLATGQRWEVNADERFAMSSTFKTLACGALLEQVDEGQLALETEVSFEESDLVTYSPVTEQYAGHQPMTLFELCDATMTTSDNTAANLVLQALGGPEAVTAFARSMDDPITRLDRYETELNEATPGDERDTTTPNAMLATLEKLVLGDVLADESRQQLEAWMKGNAVADGLFRAAMPFDWVIADRTGAGGYGSRSITAIIWPPEQPPTVAVFYITDTEASFEERNAAIASLGEVVQATLADE